MRKKQQQLAIAFYFFFFCIVAETLGTINYIIKSKLKWYGFFSSLVQHRKSKCQEIRIHLKLNEKQSNHSVHAVLHLFV